MQRQPYAAAALHLHPPWYPPPVHFLPQGKLTTLGGRVGQLVTPEAEREWESLRAFRVLRLLGHKPRARA